MFLIFNSLDLKSHVDKSVNNNSGTTIESIRTIVSLK